MTRTVESRQRRRLRSPRRDARTAPSGRALAAPSVGGPPRRRLDGVRRAARRAAAPFRALWTSSAPLRAALAPWVASARGVLGVISPLGWALVVGALGGSLVGGRLGWQEFTYLGAALALLFVAACLFALGRTRLVVGFEVAPQRVVAGDSTAARFTVRNVSRAPLLPLGLEFPVGESAARFTLPPLGPGAGYEDMVVIPTMDRGVITLGPVTTQRGDPFGIARREVRWTEPLELFVHPRTVPLEPLGAGLLRDLEGRTTNDISMSDLAFHTLRDYAPGDDRRYIHWRSSAKVSGTSSGDRFLVRQFLDTRRSHIAIVTDVAAESYRTPEEFELAVSCAASLAVRALVDAMDLTIICGEHAAIQPPPHLALDTFSRAVFDTAWPLPEATGRLNLLAPDASAVILVTGSGTPTAAFQHARAYLPREVQTLAIRVDLGGVVTLNETPGLTVVGLGRLRELARVMAGGQLA